MSTIDRNPALRHSLRFRRVSNRYALRVAEAYGGDLARAAGDTDVQVGATVAEWERQNETPVRDWRRHGAEEHGDVVVEVDE